MTGKVLSGNDLTAKARIRNATFTLIAEKGVRGTTVREIADRADVSPALVVHHFGSKQGVVDEVSRWVDELLQQATREPDRPTSPARAHEHRFLEFEKMVLDIPHLGAYLRRMLLDGAPQGLEWFTRAVDSTAAGLAAREKTGMARPSQDTRAEAAMLLILGIAPILLRPQLEHALDLDFGDEDSRARWSRAEIELLTTILYPPE